MRFFRPLFALVITVSLLTSAVACSSSNEIVARVNGEEITRTELETQVDRLKDQYPGMFDGAEGEERLLDFKRSLLASMVDAILMRQAAEDRGIVVPDEEIEEQIDSYRVGIEDFDAALAEANMTVDDLREQVREQLVAQRLIEELAGDAEVTESDIETYYDKNKDERFTQPASTHAAHILFNLEDKATAEEVLADVKAGGDFAALAEQHSQDPGSAANGGDLDWSDPSRPYVPEFETALADLDAGEVSGLVETEFGWHIIKVIDKRPEAVQPLAEVSTMIEQMILQDRNTEVFQAFLAEAREAADIEILVAELEQPEGPEVVPVDTEKE